jgi:hypothetical protein
MGRQLLPHRLGEGPVDPSTIMKNSMVEEGEPKGDGWIAALSFGVLLVGGIPHSATRHAGPRERPSQYRLRG